MQWNWFRVALPAAASLLLAEAAWAQTEDSTLVRLLALAREYSTGMPAQRALTAAAAAQVSAAAPLPSPALLGEIENVPDGFRLDQSQLRLGAEAVLFRGNRARSGRDWASRHVDVAQAAEVLAEQRAVGRVRRDVVGLLAARAMDARLASEDSLLEEAEAAQRSRFALGEARYVDVLRLRTARLNLATERLAAQMVRDLRRGALLGAFPDPPVRREVDVLLDSLERRGLRAGRALLVATWDSTAVMTLLAAARERAAAEQVVAGTSRQTEITGFAGAQRFQNGDGKYVIGPSLGFSIGLPFLVPGTNRGITAAAEARRAATVADLAAREGFLALAREQAETRYRASQTRLATIDSVLLAGARAEREAALAGFRSGELSLLELLDFERALSRADFARLEALLAAADAAAELATLPADQLLDLVALDGGN